MTITKPGLVALASLMLGFGLVGGVTAASDTTDGALPSAAYFAVNMHYCSAPAAPRSGIAVAATYRVTVRVAGSGPYRDTRPVAHLSDRLSPGGDAAIVYEEVLMAEYGGNCEDFYAKEVLPRLYLSHEGS